MPQKNLSLKKKTGSDITICKLIKSLVAKVDLQEPFQSREGLRDLGSLHRKSPVLA